MAEDRQDNQTLTAMEDFMGGIDDLLEERQEREHVEEMASQIGVTVADFNAYVHEWHGQEHNGQIITKLHLTEDVADDFLEAVENASSYEHVIDGKMIKSS